MGDGDELDLKEMDDYGYINIPTENDFFFVLTNENIFVITGRKVNLEMNNFFKELIKQNL